MKKKNRILITGSSKGLGFHLAKHLSNNPENEILINSRNNKNLHKAKKIINRCNVFKFDTTYEKNIKKMKKKIGKLDVLICNVGNSSSAKPGKEKTKDFIKSFDNNFFSAVNTIKILEKNLSKNHGKIICISSICGIEYIKGAPITYSVSKAALNAFIRFYSKVLGPKGITINGIAPGNMLFKGSVWEKKLKKNKKQTLSLINQEVSSKVLGEPKTISKFIETIIKDQSKFINGSIFTIDGGQIRSL